MLEIIFWMDDQGLVDIGQITFLEYAMAIFLANPKSFYSSKFKNEIKKYALYLSLSGTGFSKSNLDTVERIYSLSKQITDSHESEKYSYSSPSSKPNLTVDQVLEITTSNSKFRAIMNIFYIDKIMSKFTVDISGNHIRNIDEEQLDNNHIFLKSRVASFTAKSKFISIANFVLIDSAINREHIKDRIPKDYFTDINKDEKGAFYAEQNLININEEMNVYDEQSAEGFIRNRAEKIAEIVNEYF